MTDNRNEGAKMSNYSKDTKPSTIVENKKIQLTEEELKKVSGGSLSRECAGGKHFDKVTL
jgi:bacteriocin-like protein